MWWQWARDRMENAPLEEREEDVFCIFSVRFGVTSSLCVEDDKLHHTFMMKMKTGSSISQAALLWFSGCPIYPSICLCGVQYVFR
ncbi:unnamed protein product [Urochloa humidicola]